MDGRGCGAAPERWGGGFEGAAGLGLAGGAGWTGVGAVARGAVGLHGSDQLQAGLRQLFSGCQVDSFTSEGLQWGGVSRSMANIADAGISIIGSLDAGTAAEAISAGGLRNVPYYEIGHKTLSPGSFANYGQISDPVALGGQIVNDQVWPGALLPDLGGASQFGKTIPQGPTPWRAVLSVEAV